MTRVALVDRRPRFVPPANCLQRTAHGLTVSFVFMEEPEYLICLGCETPTYQFEYANGKVASAVCGTCGNDDVSEFVTEAEYDEVTGA